MTRRRLVALVSAAVLFTLGLAAVGAVLLVTRTTMGRDKLRDVLQPIIASKVRGGSIYIGHLSGSFLTNITIDSLAIKDKRGELLMSTGRATFSYNPRDIIDQRIYITRADVEHPYVHLIEHENNKWNFQEIFASGPQTAPPVTKDVKTRELLDYIVFDSTHVRDARFLVTMPWHPDDTLHGAALDSVIHLHLTNPQKAVAQTFDGYGRTYAWTNASGLLVHARLADPDSDRKFGQLFRVDSVSADEYEPTFKFRGVRGDIKHLGDSIWFDVPHFDMPASTGHGKGKVWWGSDLPVRLDIAIRGDSVSLDDVNWAYPDLPRTGGGSLDLLIKNDPDPKKLQIVDYKLVNMDVRTTKSRLLGTMSFGVGAPVLLVRNVDLRATPVDFDLLRALAGKPFAQDWQGQLNGTVKGPGGPLTHFVIADARGTFTDAHVPGAVSRFAAKGEVDILFPAFTVFHGLAVDAGAIDLRTIEYLFPVFPRLHGIASGTAVLDSSWLDVRFSNAHIAFQDGDGEPTRLSGSGRITYGDLMSYDVALQAEPLSLTMIARSYPNPLRGLFSGPVRAKGTAPDLETSFSLQGTAGTLSFDGHLDLDSIGGMGANGRGEFSAMNPATLLENSKIPAGTFSGHYDVDLAGETAASLHGTANAEIEKTVFDSVRVYGGSVRLKFADGRMSIADSLRVRTAAGTVTAFGGIGLPKGQPDSMRLSIELDSLGGLRRYISHPDTSRLGAAATPPDSLSGTLAVNAVASGTLDALNLSGRATGTSLYFNQERGDLLSVKFNIKDALGSPSGVAEIRVDTVTLAGVALDTIGATVSIVDASHAGFSVAAQSHNGPWALSTGTWSKPSGGTNSVVIDSLGLAIGDARWHLTGPATLTLDSTGTRLDSLVLRNRDTAFIAVSANIPENGAAAAQVRATGIPLKDLGVLAQLTDTITGAADFTTSVTGTKAHPQLAATLGLSSVKWRGVDIDRVTSNMQYDAARFAADLDVVRQGQTAVSGNVSLPIELTLPFTTRWHNDTISGFLRADSTDLSLLQTILGSNVTATGRLVANVRASGTQRAPVLSGAASIINGSVFAKQLGVTFSDVNGQIVGGRDAEGRDSITIKSLVAATHDKNMPVGHARVDGWIKDLMRRNGEPSFDLQLGVDQFHAFNRRSVAEVYLSTPQRADSLRLRGSVASSTLSGALRVDRGAIFLADRDIARKQAVHFQFGVDSASGPTPSAASATMQTFMTNLQIQAVPVTLGNDVRLRSKDANVKLGGELRLATSTARSTRTLATSGELVPRLGLEGSLRTEGGTYNLNLGVVQREFQVLAGGTVTFDGPPDDPILDINAKYDVKQVRDLAVIVNLNGRLLPYPYIFFKSTADYEISTSDLLSYLLTGSPGFDFGANSGTSQVLSSLLAPTLSALAANALRPSLGSWVDVFQLQLGSGTGPGANSASASAFSQYLSGSTIGAEKQFGNSVFLNVNTGFCQFYNNAPGAAVNPLVGVGAKAEYRFDPRLSLKLAYDPPTANRSCSQAQLIGLVPTPPNFSLSLAHVWRF